MGVCSARPARGSVDDSSIPTGAFRKRGIPSAPKDGSARAAAVHDDNLAASSTTPLVFNPPTTPLRERGSEGSDSETDSIGNEEKSQKVRGSICALINRSQFIIENPGRLRDVYEVDDSKVIGEGAYGAVRKGRHRQTEQIRAVKTISKDNWKKLDRFKQEIDFMKMLDHPNIIKLFETFEDEATIELVMELCSGGELFERVLEAGRFTEAQAATVMQQILRAVFYMHERGVCHRDIKPENFLFLTKDPIENAILKIIDFGLSSKIDKPDTALKTKAGTPYYVAPEVLKGSYTRAVDVWSCGVIMYTLLCGYPPFWGKTDADVLVKVRRGNFTFEPRHWHHISQDAKELISGMLSFNPNSRISAEDALMHMWIKDTAPRAPASVGLDVKFVDNLRSFLDQNRLKKVALNVIASQLQEDKLQKLREAFVAFDTNGDGKLTHEELLAGLKQVGVDSLPSGTLKAVDSDNSGVIDYTEFIAAGLDRSLYLQEAVCYSAFRVFDIDGDGQITTEELNTILNKEDEHALAPTLLTRRHAIAEVIREVDADGDGKVSFKEFMAMMARQ